LDNINRELGNGRSTLFWKDPWIDGSSLNISFRIIELTNDKVIIVVDMFVLD